MHRNLHIVSFYLFCLAVISGCGGNSNHTVDSGSKAYEAQWATSCIKLSLDDGRDTYATWSVNLSAPDWQYSQSAYLDESCSIQSDEFSERGTVTMAGSYTDEGLQTTSSGLQATRLLALIEDYANTLNDDSGNQGISVIDTTFDLLVYIDDTDNMFIDGELLGINDLLDVTSEVNTLTLSLPFNRSR